MVTAHIPDLHNSSWNPKVLFKSAYERAYKYILSLNPD